VDGELGDLLGQKYIETAFGADAKAQITQLVGGAPIRPWRGDIRTLPWMTEATRKAAIVKLQAITNNVGYPKKWRDYSKVSIVRDDFLGNSVRATEAMYDQRIVKIGQPTDKTEWYMTPPPSTPSIARRTTASTSRPAFLQPPFFDPQRDIAVTTAASAR